MNESQSYVENTYQKSQFELDMTALETVIANIFVYNIKPKIIKHFNKYKENSIKNENAILEINDLISSSSKECLKYMAPKYLKFINENYLSNDGLVTYICTQFNTLIQEDISNHIQNIT